MRIIKKRIRNVEKYLKPFDVREKVKIGVMVDDEVRTRAIMKRFSEKLQEGENVLPDAELSKVALENSEGKVIIRRDLPKEVAERYWEWSWEDFGGNTHWDCKFIPYERYPREYLLPMGLRIYVALDKNNEKWLVSETFSTEVDNEKIKMAINLFLSLFGKCEIIHRDLTRPINVKRYLEWEVLRPGQMDKERIDQAIDRIIDKKVPSNRKSLYRHNIDYLRAKNPEVLAIGEKGFYGYLVFYYPIQKIAVLESLMPNNATYILDESWEEISKLSKTEVLSKGLQTARIFHYGDWEKRIRQYIS